MFTQGHSSELLGHGRSISEFDSSAHESVTPRTASPYPKVDLTCMPILQSVLNASAVGHPQEIPDHSIQS